MSLTGKEKKNVVLWKIPFQNQSNQITFISCPKAHTFPVHVGETVDGCVQRWWTWWTSLVCSRFVWYDKIILRDFFFRISENCSKKRGMYWPIMFWIDCSASRTTTINESSTGVEHHYFETRSSIGKINVAVARWSSCDFQWKCVEVWFSDRTSTIFSQKFSVYKTVSEYDEEMWELKDPASENNPRGNVA